MATQAEFAEVMAYLGSAVAKEPTREQAIVYYDLLGDLPADVLRAAAKRAALSHQYAGLPPAGLIRKHAADLTDPIVTAAEAWAMARRVARLSRSVWRRAWYVSGSPYPDGEPAAESEFDRGRRSLPPRVARAAELYGWDAIRDTETSIAFPQFSRVYESVEQPARAEAALPPALRRPPALGRALRGIGDGGVS